MPRFNRIDVVRHLAQLRKRHGRPLAKADIDSAHQADDNFPCYSTVQKHLGNLKKANQEILRQLPEIPQQAELF